MKKGLVLMGLIGMTFLAGCVSMGTYRKKVGENEKLIEQIKKLQGENETIETLKKEMIAKEGTISTLRGTYDELITELKEEIASGEVGVRESDEELIIAMGNQVLFQSGHADLQQQGKKVLKSIAKILSNVENKSIQVEGHSDNQPIAGALQKRYPSNWELSAARAAAVVRYLIKKGDMDPASIVLVAHADNEPLASNETHEGRQQNRRVEIKLVNKGK